MFCFSEPCYHHPQCQVLRAGVPQVQSAAGGGRDHRGPDHWALSAEPCAYQRYHLDLRRDRRGAADVLHGPWHQPERADQGRPHRHPDRYRWRGCASGGRHLIIWCVLRLCRSWQPGVLPGAVHRHHYDRYQCVHHGGDLAGAWAPEEFFGHDYRQCRCH